MASLPSFPGISSLRLEPDSRKYSTASLATDKTGTHEDVFTMTFLVNVYAKCGAMENARKVFDTLPRKNVVAWTTLMTGYVHNDQPAAA
ncbi:hypothetical protein CCACVL1_30216, partial [Corchorus capsularis]